MNPLSTTDILPLDDHRARRRRRLRLAGSFHAVDERRSTLVSHLADVAELVAADRVSALWVDEYGAGLPHPHVVVDLLSDRPRRSFPRDPLRSARENGVPGVCEYKGGDGPGRGGGWGLVVSLGSDGTRSWFLVADRVSARPALSEPHRDEVMFLSGECSAVVLHRDLDEAEDADVPSVSHLPGAAPVGRRFPGWHILRDLDGRDEDSPEGHRISRRFVVARLPMLYVEDELVIPEARRREQARRAREELMVRSAGRPGGPEEDLWASVLDAFEDGDLTRLASDVLELGLSAEAQGHQHGAGELLATAYEISAAVGDPGMAVEAARRAGRSARHRGVWTDAHRWYEVARGVASAAGRLDQVAVILEGVGATHRERGNLPAARTSLRQALAVAEASGDAVARGRTHHGFMGLEQAAGNLDEALRHGWKAVSVYEDDANRTRGLAGLAAVFHELGRLDAAEDAWLLVRHLSREEYYTLYAVDALSHLAALRGDAATFARRAAESDALGWNDGPKGAKADIMLHRGLSYRALGQTGEARRWLERTLRFAEEAGFSRILFEAEEALDSLAAQEMEATEAQSVDPPPPVATEVEADLRAMRCELVGSGA